MKKDGYRLGTLSEHATGSAVDVDIDRNAHIAQGWQQIEAFTGISLDHAQRKAQWKNAPQLLHGTIERMNAAFVKKLKAAIEAQGAAAEGPQLSQAITAAVEADPHLRRLGFPFVFRWRSGFFGMPWDLVRELHEEGLIWGATFASPDLHHFELPKSAGAR